MPGPRKSVSQMLKKLISSSRKLDFFRKMPGTQKVNKTFSILSMKLKKHILLPTRSIAS